MAFDPTKQDKLIADNLNFNTQGSFTNQGELTTNQTLSLTAKSITNDKDAAINAANSTHLDSQSYLNNQGLINGNATYIKAKNTINNQAGGRIYGTHLAIAADTLNKNLKRLQVKSKSVPLFKLQPMLLKKLSKKLLVTHK